MVAPSFNSSSQEAETSRSLQIPGQHGLCIALKSRPASTKEWNPVLEREGEGGGRGRREGGEEWIQLQMWEAGRGGKEHSPRCDKGGWGRDPR